MKKREANITELKQVKRLYDDLNKKFDELREKPGVF